jgi:hypothetical protein
LQLSHSFFFSCFSSFFVDQSLSLTRCCFCRITHANSLFFLCYSQLIWKGTFRFDKKKQSRFNTSHLFSFCLAVISVYGFGRLFRQSIPFFRRVLSQDPPNTANLFVVLNTHLCYPWIFRPTFTTNYIFISFILFGETLLSFLPIFTITEFPYSFSFPCSFLSLCDHLLYTTTTHIMRCDMLFNSALSLLLAARLTQAGPVYESFSSLPFHL